MQIESGDSLAALLGSFPVNSVNNLDLFILQEFFE